MDDEGKRESCQQNLHTRRSWKPVGTSSLHVLSWLSWALSCQPSRLFSRPIPNFLNFDLDLLKGRKWIRRVDTTCIGGILINAWLLFFHLKLSLHVLWQLSIENLNNKSLVWNLMVNFSMAGCYSFMVCSMYILHYVWQFNFKSSSFEHHYSKHSQMAPCYHLTHVLALVSLGTPSTWQC